MPPLRSALLAALLLGPLAHAQVAVSPAAEAPPAAQEAPAAVGEAQAPDGPKPPDALGAPAAPPEAPAEPAAAPAPEAPWQAFPESARPPSSAPAAPAAPGTGAPRLLAPPRPEDFNQVSLFGGQALGAGNRAVAAFLGFPLLGARAAVGVAPWLDVGVGFESFYGVMNDVRAFARVNLVGSGRWDVSLVLEGSRAFFTQKPVAEDRGARWLTGRRNWNVAPGFQLNLRGTSPQAARLFADVRYHLAVDTEPFQESPLGGLPPEVLLSHNLPVRFGAELPFSPSTSFLAQFGFDIHGSARDAPFMPVIGVGVVTAL